MTGQLVASTLRVSTPLIFAALGGMFCERSGVINIALEGMMLMGAFGAAVGTLVSHSPWLGSACGMGAGVLLAAIYGLFVIRLRANQIVAGMAINMLAMGLTPFFCKILYDVTGSTPSIPIAERFQSAPLYLSWGLVVICFLWMRYTPTGLWESGCGTSDASGTSVAGIEDSDDPGVFTASTGAIGAWVWNLARAAAAGVAPAWNCHAGTREPVSAGTLRSRVQSAVSGLSIAAGQRVFALPEKGPGCGVLGATATSGEPG